MATWDQQLISRIILTGDIQSVKDFGITPDDFQTPEGRTIFPMMLRYHDHPPTDDAVWGPHSLKQQFPTFHIIDDPSMTIEALCYEVRQNRQKCELRRAIQKSIEVLEVDPSMGIQIIEDFVEKNTKLIATERPASVAEIFAPQQEASFLSDALGFEVGGPPSLIVGQAFSAKTMVVQDMALGCASGTWILGGHRCRPGRALHFDYEQGARLTNMRYQKLARGRQLLPGHIDGRLAVNNLPGFFLDDSDAVAKMKRAFDGYDLVIIDSLRAACPRTDENSSDARKSLDNLHRVAADVGCAVVVVHHANKGQASGAAAIRGSTAIRDAADNIFQLKGAGPSLIEVKHDKARALGRPVPEFQLKIVDVIGSDGYPGLQVVSVAAETTSGLSLEQRIVHAVGTLGRCSKNAIYEQVGGAKSTALKAVDELTSVGHLRLEHGKYVLPFQGGSPPAPPKGGPGAQGNQPNQA